MNLDPSTLVILLNLNGFVLEPVKIFDLFDPGLERCFAAIVEHSGNDCTTNSQKLVPGDSHDNEHDQVEQGQLQYDKEAVEDTQEENDCQCIQKGRLETRSLLDHWVVLWLKRSVKLLKLTPKVGIFDVLLTELPLVLLTHVELLALRIPNENFLHTR